MQFTVKMRDNRYDNVFDYFVIYEYRLLLIQMCSVTINALRAPSCGFTQYVC